jgi:SpoVK/Ycf46/Vps4 family AAA+-type ATPase
MDEADSLLYDRGSFAAQEHDIRFVNIMLQELERFEGVIILTSNMDALLDPALERRIGLKIKFESPDKKSQTDIWKMHIPDNISLSSDISFEALAGKYDFSGGNIKNAVLNAIRRIGRDNRMTMTMSDLVFGADLEKEGMFTKKEGRRIVGFAEKY